MATFKKQIFLIFLLSIKAINHPADDCVLDTRNMVVSNVKVPFLEYTFYFGKQNSLNEKTRFGLEFVVNINTWLAN